MKEQNFHLKDKVKQNILTFNLEEFVHSSCKEWLVFPWFKFMLGINYILFSFNRIIRYTLSYLKTMDKPQHIYCGSILPSKIGKVSWVARGKFILCENG